MSQNVLQAVQKQVNASDEDINTFRLYYNDTITLFINKFTVGVADNSISTDADVLKFSEELKQEYLRLYNTFLQIKRDYPSSIEEFSTRFHKPVLPTCNTTPCDNIGFENGNLSGWTGCYAQITSSTTTFSTTAFTCTGPYGAVTAADNDPTITGQHRTATNQFYLMSGTGTDPISGQPVVCPSGGSYSCRLGDSTVPGSQMAEIENTWLVTPAVCNFTYYYSVILQNPGHTRTQQPFFNVTMYDQNGDTIPFCGNYAVTSGYETNLFDSTTYNGAKTYYKPWTGVFVPLQKYIGQCVSIVVETSDCEPGGHFGYAYFDAVCSPLNIITSAPAVCGKPITLTGPAGGASYQWVGPCIIGAANTQTITVGCAGKYTVIVQSVIGATCADTLDTIIASSIGVPPVADFVSDSVCAGAPTQFTNLTTGGGAGNVYSWNFGDAGSGTNDTITGVSNPTHTYPGVGTYTATLSALNNGCGGDTSFPVVVISPPVAGFTATTECLNNPTVFTNTSTGTTVWNWNFGEPSSGAHNVSSIENPSHTYASAGTFTVTLVDGTNCTDSTQVTVTVNPLPNATFTYTPACFGETTTFTDNSTIAAGSSITTWSWNFGDPISGANNTSNVENPTHAFSAAGTYNVILTVTSNSNCQSTITIPVIVSAVPVAGFNTSTVCQGHPTIFYNKSTVSIGVISSGTWSYGDGKTGALIDSVHTYALPGTYTATLTVSSGSGCIDSSTNTVIVNPMPVAKFIADTVCLGNTTMFTDTSTIGGGGAISTWLWQFGDGATSALQNPTHPYAKAGTYNVTLTVISNMGCDSTITLPVIVNPLPQPAFVATTPCQGNATVFTDNSTIGNGNTIQTWKWTFGDGDSSAVSAPSHTYPAAGTYNVGLVVTSNNGCVDSTKNTITVNPNPVVNFGSPDSGCVSLCVKFTDSSKIAAPDTNVSWLWNFGDSTTSTEENPTHCYTKVDTFSVTLTVTSNKTCTTTGTKQNYIITYPVPTANFLATPNPTTIVDPVIYFYDESLGNPVSWYWTFGDNLDSISLSQNTVHTYKDTGTFLVDLIISNKYNCFDSIKEPVIIQPEWTFYVPNAFTPNNGGLNQTFSGVGTELLSYEMWIFDRWGMLLYHCTDINQPWNGRVNNTSADICQEDTYVYLIEITDVFHNAHRYVGRVTLIK